MKQPACFGRDVGVPIAVSMGVLFLLNLCWNVPFPDIEFYRIVPHQIGVYLVCCLIALPFLARSLRRGTLSAGDAGLGIEGWKPQCRLVGLVMTVGLVAILFAKLFDLQKPPAFGDYCFWLFFLLPASMTELLVFVCLGFCLPERWLRDRGWRPTWAVLLAGFFSGVAFGLYHYTHELPWHELAPQLTVVMWITLTCFVLTRNFHLTFLLHNSMAAVGFTEGQYRKLPPADSMNPATYLHAWTITMFIMTFAVPYVLLHVLEWRHWPPRQVEPSPADAG